VSSSVLKSFLWKVSFKIQSLFTV